MQSLRVLVTEDEKIVAEDLRDRLVSLGYEVVGIASSGEEAINLAQQLVPDVILMDIRLKGPMDGLEAAQRIRQTLDIPIIYLTAYADENTFQKAMSTEPLGYLLKPIESRELHTSISMAFYKHKLEKKLKESEEWLGTTLRSIGDAVIATDGKGCVKFMNPAAERLTGWKEEEAFGKELSEVFESYKHQSAKSSTVVSKDGQLVASKGQTTFVSRDGTVVPIDDTIAPIRDDRGNVTGVVVVFKDITDRIRAEEVVRGMSKRILDAQEGERRRVARELHDSIIQLLSSVKFRLNMVEEQTTYPNENVQKSADKARELLERAIGEIRRISRNLRPSELDDLGLVPSIRILCEEFKERTHLNVHLEILKAPKDCPPDVQLALYRILQESLCNIEKHANATTVHVRFGRQDSILELSIRDNGRGFDMQTANARRTRDNGLGFLDMKERVAFVGAKLTINSSEGSGTHILVEAPLQHVNPNDHKKTTVQ